MNLRFHNLRPSATLFLTGVGVLSILAAGAFAQQAVRGKVKNFVVPDYDSQNRKRAVLTGEEAQARANNLWLITKLKIETFAPDEKIAWIVEAPECLYEYEHKIASSDGPLNVRSADGQFTIAGRGFEWRQANQHLVISNAVKTLIKGAAVPDTNKTATLSRQDLEIAATNFVFEAEQYRAIYAGGVAVRELASASASNQPMTLDCQTLTVKMPSAGGGIESILAEEQVVFTQGSNRTSGDRAWYAASNDVVEITGHATWENEFATGQGDRLELDRQQDIFKALGNARARLKASGAASSVRPGQPIEIQADSLTARLPSPTNPAAHIVAEGRVSIKHGDQQAQGERATYTGTATNGQMVLTGNPSWRAPDAEGKADMLVFDREQNEFQGRGNGHILLVQKPSQPGTLGGGRTMEIQADLYDYRTNRTLLTGNVRAHDPEWKMACQEMTLENQPATNRLARILARGDVAVEQLVAGGSNQPPWKLTCRQSQLDLAADGRHIQKVVAEDQVLVEPARPPAPGERGFPWKVQCARLTMHMAPQTNRFSRIVAENQVRISQTANAPNPPGASLDPAWKLDCDRLTLFASEKTGEVESALAEQNIEMEMLEAQAGGRLIPVWRLGCDRATLQMAEGGSQEIQAAQAEQNVRVTRLSTNGLAEWKLESEQAALTLAPCNRIERVTAERKVRIEEQTTTNAVPMKLRCEAMRMDLGASNDVQRVEARQNVVMEQGRTRATGQIGIYTADRNEVELRGDPTLVYVDQKSATATPPPREIQVEGAEVLIWNRASNHFRGRGPFRIVPKGPMKLPP